MRAALNNLGPSTPDAMHVVMIGGVIIVSMIQSHTTVLYSCITYLCWAVCSRVASTTHYIACA